MAVFGDATMQMFREQHPDLCLIWEAEAKQRQNQFGHERYGLTNALGSGLAQVTQGLWPFNRGLV